MEQERTSQEAISAQVILIPRWIQLVMLPLLLIGLWGVARAAGPVLLVFLVAGLLALILNPLVRRFEQARLPRGVAIACVYLTFLIAIAGIGALVANPIANQVQSFQDNFPQYVTDANHSLASLQGWLDHHGIHVKIQSGGESALTRLEHDIVGSSGKLVGFTRDFLGKVIGALIAVVLTLVVSIYMLIYGKRIGDGVRGMLPPAQGPDDDLPTRVERAVASYIRGQLLFSLIMGGSAAAGLWIFGATGIFPEGRTYAGFFGVFYGLMELLPFIGPILGAAPPVLIALLQHPLTAFWLVLLFLGLQQVEGHIVAPNVFGRALRINPLLVIFALLFGYELYGVIGALVSLPVAAMLRESIVYFHQHARLEPWPAVVGVQAGVSETASATPPPVARDEAQP
jgi:predicted PurR-regulated permease PerM